MRYTTILILLLLCEATLALGMNSLNEKASDEFVSSLIETSDTEYVSIIAHMTVQADITELDRQLLNMKATRAFRHAQVIRELRRVADESQPFVSHELEALKEEGLISGYTPFWVTNCFVVYGTKQAVYRIAELAEIEFIEPNFRPELIEPVKGRSDNASALDENHGVPSGIRAIGADRVWHELGITGAGRLVGNIDTGVDGNHPALAARWRGLVAPADECWLDVVGTSEFPIDDPSSGHGTHTMGTICGNSTVSNDSIGVAPGATWIASNGINQSAGAETFTNDILTAFQWLADPDSNELTINDVPDVVQNSWGVNGSFPGFSDCYSSWNDAIINCEAAGIVIVFSAGNEGPLMETLRSPATYEIDSVTVFSVGAVDADSDTIPPYEIASFSSRGPSSCSPTPLIKPEVCAPGVDVYSSLPGTISEPNNYARKNGTSMAGPHVAGIVALMREANPNADVREIKSVLMQTAIDMGEPGEDNTFGIGFVDAFAAVTEISANRAIVEGTVYDAVSNEPINGATVRAGEQYIRSTNIDGEYRMSLRGDSTWMMSADAYGYISSSASVTPTVGDTTAQDFTLDRVPSGVISGRVITGSDRSVPGATVEFMNAPLPQMVTDTDGRFMRTVPADSTFTLRIRYHDVFTSENMVVTANDTIHGNIYLESARTLPEGPDVYGYYAYDMLDDILPPEYDWVEITPARDGPGTGGLPPGNDRSMQIVLPFSFWYYGNAYDTLIINENGWIATELSSLGFFQNGTIPSASGPGGMLAPFWDNLFHVDDAEVSWWYDETNQRVVIEFYKMRIASQSENVVTFQVQIFDRDARTTATGDCEIVFLYEETGLAFMPTVGIENPEETIGLQLQYNEGFASHTWQVSDHTAILFSTSYIGSVTGNITGHPEPDDFTDAVISSGTSQVNANSSGYYELNGIRSGLQEITVSLNGYETIATTVDIPSQQSVLANVEIWRLDPAQNLAAELNDNNSVSLNWDAPESVGSLDDLQDYLIYENGGLLTSTTELEYQTEIITEPGDYEYYIVAQYEGGQSLPSDSAMIEVISDAESAPGSIPTEFALQPPYPNPFNMSTTIQFALPHASKLSLQIFDVLGREVATVVSGEYSAGYHRYNWNADGLSAGLYFVRMNAGDYVMVRKLMLIK